MQLCGTEARAVLCKRGARLRLRIDHASHRVVQAAARVVQHVHALVERRVLVRELQEREPVALQLLGERAPQADHCGVERQQTPRELHVSRAQHELHARTSSFACARARAASRTRGARG